MSKFTSKLSQKGATKKEFKGLIDELKNLGGKVEIGFIAGLSAPENIEKAVFAEYGTENAPERPVVRPAFDKYAKSKAKARRKVPSPSGDGRTRQYKKALRKYRDLYLIEIAQEMANAIREEIITKKTPRNADATIARKGFDDPLIETGEMRDDVSWRVRNPKGQIISQGFWNSKK